MKTMMIKDCRLQLGSGVGRRQTVTVKLFGVTARGSRQRCPDSTMTIEYFLFKSMAWCGLAILWPGWHGICCMSCERNEMLTNPH